MIKRILYEIPNGIYLGTLYISITTPNGVVNVCK